eukprot:1098986-Lingulodinium_polyedra.AAC.1
MRLRARAQARLRNRARRTPEVAGKWPGNGRGVAGKWPGNGREMAGEKGQNQPNVHAWSRFGLAH